MQATPVEYTKGIAEHAKTNRYQLAYRTQHGQSWDYRVFNANSPEEAIARGLQMAETIAQVGAKHYDPRLRPYRFPAFHVSRWIDYGKFSSRYWNTIAKIK